MIKLMIFAIGFGAGWYSATTERMGEIQETVNDFAANFEERLEGYLANRREQREG